MPKMTTTKQCIQTPSQVRARRRVAGFEAQPHVFASHERKRRRCQVRRGSCRLGPKSRCYGKQRGCHQRHRLVAHGNQLCNGCAGGAMAQHQANGASCSGKCDRELESIDVSSNVATPAWHHICTYSAVSNSWDGWWDNIEHGLKRSAPRLDQTTQRWDWHSELLAQLLHCGCKLNQCKAVRVDAWGRLHHRSRPTLLLNLLEPRISRRHGKSTP